jgi:hypothetical protein
MSWYRKKTSQLGVPEEPSMENIGLGHLTLYHGTSGKNAREIISSGLTANKNLGPKWYVLSTDLDDAIFHSDGPGHSAVIVFEVPTSGDEDYWEGHPYLWPGKGASGSFKGTWYALMEDLPTNFVKQIIKITDDDIKRVKRNV